jgi:CHAT domain-containing protein/tetratricopeptide (TPR) repeat protein
MKFRLPDWARRALEVCALTTPADSPAREADAGQPEPLVRRAQGITDRARELARESRTSTRALRLAEQAVALLEAAPPARRSFAWKVALLDARVNLACLLLGRGDSAAAVPLLERALRLIEALNESETYPDGRPALATSLKTLGFLFHACGEDRRAMELYSRALEKFAELYPEHAYPDGHPEWAACLDNLGSLLEERGDHTHALPLLERALQMREALYPARRYPNGHPDLAASLHHLAAVLHSRGEQTRALALLKRALKIREALYPQARFSPGHPEVAQTLSSLALVLQARGEPTQALSLFARAATMFDALYPPEQHPDGHPDLATALYNLGAALLRSSSESDRAMALLRRALKMFEAQYPPRRFPSGHPRFARILDGMAGMMWQAGNTNLARRFARRALKMFESCYPRARYPQGHPELAGSLLNNGMIVHAAREQAGAWPMLDRAVEMYQAQLELLLPGLAEAEALNFLATHTSVRDRYLSLRDDGCATYPANLHRACWNARGALLRLVQRRHTFALGSRDSATAGLLEQLRDARQRLARYLLRPADPSRTPQGNLAVLTETKERLERHLASRLPAVGITAAAPGDLTRCLPPQSAFIDLVRYNHSTPTSDPSGQRCWQSRGRYVAFILAPGRATAQVNLGLASEIDRAVATWLRAIAAERESPAAETLRRCLWEPIAQLLPRGTRTIYLCPDGSLCRLPWAALPGPRPGTVLLEEYAFAVVPSGPFLYEQLQPRRRSRRGKVLTVGGVAYDYSAHCETADAEAVAALRDGKPFRWPRLPGTAREAEWVAALAAPREVTTLVSTAATARRVLSELPRARYAHFATHGFFAGREFRSALQVDEDGFQRDGHERASAGARNPLVLSGLVFAGANARRRSARGIVTAEVLVSLDLHRLDLAVLSACETGLGEVAGGEGVMGLTRAFHAAGTRDVVASLWKVDDDATAALMTLFYHRLWKEGRSPLDALREAQLTLYHHPERIRELTRPRGLKLDKVVKLPGDRVPREGRNGAPPVKQWAAFVLSGAGREHLPTRKSDSNGASFLRTRTQ